MNRSIHCLFIGNKVEDVTCRIVEGTSQLIELALQIQDGVEAEPQTVALHVDPLKLQTLLYGKLIRIDK